MAVDVAGVGEFGGGGGGHQVDLGVGEGFEGLGWGQKSTQDLCDMEKGKLDRGR